jgi:transaldolase
MSMLGERTILQEMTSRTSTALWNDSCSISELEYSLEQGAVGATSNPVIVGDVLKKELHLWSGRIHSLVAEMPTGTEDEIAWKLIEEMSVKAAQLLLPAFETHKGRNGRLSIQTDPRLYGNADAIVRQALHFHGLARNMIVKIPVTKAGVAAIEEATFQGVSINATVSFSLPQALAVAEAVERGLSRREKLGMDISTMGPVCTIMVGRLDDWLKVLVEKKGIVMTPGNLEWAGVAVMKKAYQVYRDRGYRLRLLSAAFRNHMHWSEFIGGDVVISPPCAWQKRFNHSDIKVCNRMDVPVDPEIVIDLTRRFTDFRRAYEEEGMRLEEFDTFGPTVRTLRQFIAAYANLVGVIRDFMLPNPEAN